MIENSTTSIPGIKWDLQNLSIEYFWQVFVYLFKIPLEVEIREACDQGHPIVLAAPDSVVSRAYGNIAEKVVQKLKEKQFQPEILLWNVSLCRHNTPVPDEEKKTELVPLCCLNQGLLTFKFCWNCSIR